MPKARVCMSCDVYRSDAFRSMSPDARALYAELQAEADADGFIANPLSATRGAGLSTDALDELVKAGELIPFLSGHLIDAWWVNNTKDVKNYRAGMYREQIVARFGDAKESDGMRRYSLCKPDTRLTSDFNQPDTRLTPDFNKESNSGNEGKEVTRLISLHSHEDESDACSQEERTSDIKRPDPEEVERYARANGVYIDAPEFSAVRFVDNFNPALGSWQEQMLAKYPPGLHEYQPDGC